METFLKTLAYVGAFESILLVLTVIYAAALWTRGVFPALLRLGNGLSKRKIAIFAKGDNMSSLKSLIIDSKLFKATNIYEIRKRQDIGRAESATMFLVFWHDWSGEIDEILDKKSDQCALIIYAPSDKGRIPDERMKVLDGRRHTAVTNFRGRLLNDIVVSMITTGYEKV